MFRMLQKLPPPTPASGGHYEEKPCPASGGDYSFCNCDTVSSPV